MAYTLRGTDGISFSGGGEGGSTYQIQPDGTKLRRVSTGWWNPYGMSVDAFGRVFGTDNDPGASPPCRLIQVIEGGNYGYEYRYGRTGLHPLTCWNGEIPGTLPMISGTGEAPCAIVAYESHAFPKEYLGNLFVPCWADHRVERYTITQRADQGLVHADRDILIEGPDDFRPVGIDVAPDGTVYISDWVSSSYSLHKQGRIWRIRPKLMPKSPEEPKSLAVEAPGGSKRRRRRSRRFSVLNEYPFFKPAELAEDEKLLGIDERTNPESLKRLQRRLSLESTVKLSESSRNALHVLAARLDGARPEMSIPARAQSMLSGLSSGAEELMALLFQHDDPLLAHAALQMFSREVKMSHAVMADTKHGLWILLAARQRAAVRSYFAKEKLDLFLTAANPDTRFVAIKWIADEKLVDYRSDLERMLNSSDLDYRLFRAVAAAIDRLDDIKPSDQPSVKLLLAKINDSNAAVEIRSLCLRMISPTSKGLRLDDLIALTAHSDANLRLEAVRTLASHPDAQVARMLAELAVNVEQSVDVRAAAIAGLAATAESHVELMLNIATNDASRLRDEALRSLVGVQLTKIQIKSLLKLSNAQPQVTEAVDRILQHKNLQHKNKNRPPHEQTKAWKQLLTGAGDPSAGQRIFFGTKVGTCAKCHTIDGRGSAVGPDLSKIRQRIASEGVEWLLETILQPSKQMAPQYTPWQIVLTNGKTLIGLPRRKGGSGEAYLDIDGKEFLVKKPNIEFHREMPTSIMPEGLLHGLTVQELNDLFAFILSSAESG